MPGKRIQVIDDIKSSLVVMMLLFHSASMLNSAAFADYLQRLAFIHLAFVLVTGFLLGFHYNVSPVAPAVRTRLLLRGTKILLLFLAINMLFYAIGTFRFSELSGYYEEIGGATFFLAIPGKYCAFEILYYIGLFLLTGIVFLSPVPWWVSIAVGICSMLWGAFPFFNALGWGLLGMGAGTVCQQSSVQQFLIRGKKFCWAAVPLLAAMQLYFHRPYGILLFIECVLWFLSFICVLQIGGAGRKIALLGKYTLFAYLFQMLLIRFCAKIATKIHVSDLTRYFFVFILSSIMCYVGIVFLNYLRKRFSKIDSLYKLIFS